MPNGHSWFCAQERPVVSFRGPDVVLEAFSSRSCPPHFHTMLVPSLRCYHCSSIYSRDRLGMSDFCPLRKNRKMKDSMMSLLENYLNNMLNRPFKLKMKRTNLLPFHNHFFFFMNNYGALYHGCQMTLMIPSHQQLPNITQSQSQRNQHEFVNMRSWVLGSLFFTCLFLSHTW